MNLLKINKRFDNLLLCLTYSDDDICHTLGDNDSNIDNKILDDSDDRNKRQW